MPTRLYETQFHMICKKLHLALLDEAEDVKVPEWQSLDVSNSPMHITRELTDISIRVDLPESAKQLADLIKPNLPWADQHFDERVSGIPHNPPPSHVNWPWARHNAQHQKDEKFSHTYPERFWPKGAGFPAHVGHHKGIRFAYGDLNDVVDLLERSPLTRQAYLPVWFPEDTGAVHRERVPCTLGYHFLIRKNRLNTTYFIRSCDFIRHFRDDVYLAGRLGQWVADQLAQRGLRIYPGYLLMHIGSLHVFAGDLPNMKREREGLETKSRQGIG